MYLERAVGKAIGECAVSECARLPPTTGCGDKISKNALSEIAKSLNLNLSDELMAENVNDFVMFSMFGWEISNSISAQYTTAKCNLCFIDIALWNANDEVFEVYDNHRWYCPWVSMHGEFKSQVGGWQVLVKVLGGRCEDEVDPLAQVLEARSILQKMI